MIWRRPKLPPLYKIAQATSPLVYCPMNETEGPFIVNIGTLGAAANGMYDGPTLANTPAPGGGMAPWYDGEGAAGIMGSEPLLAALSPSLMTMSIFVKVTAAIWQDGSIHEMIAVTPDWSAQYGIELINGFIYTYPGEGSVACTTEDWFHVAATFDQDNNQIILYLNGVAESTTEWTGVGAPLVDAYFGANLLTNGGVFKGWLAHGAFWDRVLTPTEISNLYKFSRI